MNLPQRNIESFGGDPEKVLIFGQSAGGFAVMMHLLSEGSEGLFHRAIVQSSGYPFGDLATNDTFDAVALCEKVVRNVGCSVGNGVSTDETLRCLRHKPASKLVAAATDFSAIRGFPWLPIGDANYSSPFFTTDGSGGLPKQLILSGPVLNNVPVIMGTTRNEGLLDTGPYFSDRGACAHDDC